MRKVGHDLKQATIVLAEHGVTLAGHRHRHRARELPGRRQPLRAGARRAGARAADVSRLRARVDRRQGREGDLVPARWRRRRADVGRRARRPRRPGRADRARSRCTTPRSTPVYETLERPLVPVLVALEQAGVRIDTGRPRRPGRAPRRRARRRAPRASTRWPARRFNINSPKQLGDVLFMKLQLPALKRTGKPPRRRRRRRTCSRSWRSMHDLPREVIDWRGLQKLKGTYVDALPSARASDDRPRPHAVQPDDGGHGPALERAIPNLQNVPIRTELGREIRRAFIAEPGWRLISADYSQIELRVLAHLSGDPNLVGGVPRSRGHPRPHRAQGVRRAQRARRRTSCGGAPRSSTTRCSTGRRRSRCRATSASRPRRRKEFIDAYFAGFPAVRALSRRHHRGSQGEGHRLDALRPPPQRARTS